jgi:hypothetical protein
MADIVGRTAPTVTGGGGGFDIKKILDLLGSTGIGAYGASESAGEDRQLTREQMAQRQLESDRSHQLSQATAATAASPLGAEQSFAQKQAIAKAILGGARNFSVAPGDSAVAGAMGTTTGGARIPEGGFDPAMLERLFGDPATLASITQRAKTVGQLNPAGPTMNLGPLFGQAGTDATSQIAGANAGELARQQEAAARQRELIMRAIDEDIRGEKQPKKNKAKSALGGAASGAMTGASIGSIVPGIGTGIGAAVGGGIGLLKGLF